MISADQIVGLAGASAALMLASQKLGGFRLSLEIKAWMVLAWLLIIVAIMAIGAHLPPGRFGG